jgi:hypothetical protein
MFQSNGTTVVATNSVAAEMVSHSRYVIKNSCQYIVVTTSMEIKTLYGKGMEEKHGFHYSTSLY